MKYLILLTIFFATHNSYGWGRNDKVELPDTAKLIYGNVIEDVDKCQEEDAMQVSCDKAIADEYTTVHKTLPFDHCMDVYIYTTQSTYNHGCYARGYLMASVKTNIYCVERSIGDSYLVSLRDSCRISPIKECFSESLKASLNAISPTKYHRVLTGSCRSNANRRN